MDRKIKIIVLGIVLVLFLSLGGAYAWVTFTTNSIIVGGNTHCFNINYVKGKDITGNIGAIREDDYIIGNTIWLSSVMGIAPISLELSSNCNKISGIGTIKLNVSSLSNAFTSSGNSYGALKYVLAEYDPSDFVDSSIKYLKNNSFDIIEKGVITETGTFDIHTEYLEAGVYHNYLVIIYIDKNLVGEDVMGASVSATVSASANQFVSSLLSDFTYVTDTYDGFDVPYGNVLLVSYDGTDTVVNVPSSYVIEGTSYNVMVYSNTSNGTSTFANNTLITDVNFASGALFYEYDGTNLISNSASSLFKGCTSLINEPVLPNSITNMDNTYEGCTSLIESKHIPSSTVSMIGTFKNCSGLERVMVIPSLVTNMNSTFYGCSSLGGSIVINSDSVSSASLTFTNTVNDIVVNVLDSSTTYSTFDGNTTGNVTISTYSLE